ncbi:MAG: PhoX family phosphatase, partial [Alphaproteobacteria bacterium]|nr:PhoX family phosphatase [Alphaproteobacteria bacterium]
MAKDFTTMEDSNRSCNHSIHEVSDPARRLVLGGGAMAALVPFLAPVACVSSIASLAGCAVPAGGAGPKLGFAGVAAGSADALVVPAGYSATPIVPWGDPVG